MYVEKQQEMIQEWGIEQQDATATAAAPCCSQAAANPPLDFSAAALDFSAVAIGVTSDGVATTLPRYHIAYHSRWARGS